MCCQNELLFPCDTGILVLTDRVSIIVNLTVLCETEQFGFLEMKVGRNYLNQCILSTRRTIGYRLTEVAEVDLRSRKLAMLPSLTLAQRG
jgi:hypothetical protein